MFTDVANPFNVPNIPIFADVASLVPVFVVDNFVAIVLPSSAVKYSFLYAVFVPTALLLVGV